MKTASTLEQILASGDLAVTSECGPPRGSSAEKVREKAELLRGYVDGVNVTDNQTAMVRMSSLAACIILKQMGLNPILQMVTRDRNRLAMQSDILGAYAHGIDTMLCLSGDHPHFGDHPMAATVHDIDSIQLIQMVKNMVKLVGVSLPDAVRMASVNPARALGIGGRKGSIEPRKDADAVVFSGEFDVLKTVVGGRLEYEAKTDKTQ